VTTVVRGAGALWRWGCQLWDPAVGLVANPPGGYCELGSFAGRHLVRETAWFALDALDHGDTALATQALTTVLDRQYDCPGRPWHGTFPIFEHDPEPGDDAVMWLSYDPNWRQFVGVTLALIVDAHGSALPADLVGRCLAAVRRCVVGEPPGRIPASYTNPALMHAWLADWAARRLGEPALAVPGHALAAAVMSLFEATGTVPEFNSPTYDGVNLMAATLWTQAPEPLGSWGRRLVASMAAALDFLYHPGLHNLCGPYTRSYGMDLGSRLTLYGLWRLVALGDAGALPDLEAGVVDHSHDLFFAPLVAWAAPRCPEPFPPGRLDFPRQQTFELGGGRRATARLERSFMIGAESGGRGGLLWDQYVPGSVHWRDNGRLLWLRVQASAWRPVDCRLLDGRTLEVGVGDSSDEVVISTNAEVVTAAATGGTSRRRLGTRVEVEAAGFGSSVEEGATGFGGVRLSAHPAGATVVIRVTGG
jgi:hypothetical protein